MSTKGFAQGAFFAAGAAQAAVTVLAALRPASPRALALVVAVGFLVLLRYAAIAGLGGTMGRNALLSSACAAAWAASFALLAFALFLAGRREPAALPWGAAAACAAPLALFAWSAAASVRVVLRGGLGAGTARRGSVGAAGGSAGGPTAGRGEAEA